MKNYVKTVLCVPVFLWIMGASVLFAQEVKAVKLKETALLKLLKIWYN